MVQFSPELSVKLLNRAYGISTVQNGILRLFSAQAQDIYSIISTYIQYVIYIHGIFFCLFVNNTWIIISHVLQNKNTSLICKPLKCLSSTTCTVKHRSTSQCCPVLPRFPPQCSYTANRSVCVHLNEWNWDCKVLVVMKCGGCTHQ